MSSVYFDRNNTLRINLKFVEWNNAIGEHFFNEEKEGSNILLFLTIEDLPKIGRAHGLTGTDDELIKSFFGGIKIGGVFGLRDWDLIDYMIQSMGKWKSHELRFDSPLNIDGSPVKYPLYLTYLVLTILPITGDDIEHLNANAYYPRLWKFFKEHDISYLKFHNNQHPGRNWNPVWNDLEKWCNEIMNGALGKFNILEFSNPHWVYVCKPLSQVIFPRSKVRRLPRLFESSGLVPHSNLYPNQLRNALRTYGRIDLDLDPQVVSMLYDEDDGLGNTIVQIAENEYHQWDGYTNVTLDDEIQVGFKISELRYSVDLDIYNESASFSFRLFSREDFPSDLSFQDKNCTYENEGFSNELYLSIREDQELIDQINRWKARLVRKTYRILVHGGNFGLSGWVEISDLIPNAVVLILANEKIGQKVLVDHSDTCRLLDYEGVPVGLSLIKVENIADFGDLFEIPEDGEVEIDLIGGLKKTQNVYYPGILPKVIIRNITNDQRVILISDCFKNGEIELKRMSSEIYYFELPKEIVPGYDYSITIIGTDHSRLFHVVGYTLMDMETLFSKVPERDRFAEVASVNGVHFAKGLEIYDRDQEETSPIDHRSTFTYFICPSKLITSLPTNEASSDVQDGFSTDLILNYISSFGECSTDLFRRAFTEVYNTKIQTGEIEESADLTSLKRWSLNRYDLMNFLDYDRSSDKVYALPTRMIPVPVAKGRKAVLLGSRTNHLVEQISSAAAKLNLNVSLRAQSQEYSNQLLPFNVTISSGENLTNHEAELALESLNNQFKLSYDKSRFHSLILGDFSGTIYDYENGLEPDLKFRMNDWSQQKFNESTLAFEPVAQNEFSPDNGLYFYKLTEYKFVYRLWNDGMPYYWPNSEGDNRSMNRDWGRYICLNKAKKNVILYSKPGMSIVCSVFVPSKLPLPRYLGKSLILFSGRAPRVIMKTLEGRNYLFHLYENVPNVFLKNSLERKLGQKAILLDHD